MKQLKNKKIFWNSVLLFVLLLFIYGLKTQNLIINIICIVSSIIINKYGKRYIITYSQNDRQRINIQEKLWNNKGED